MDLIDLTGNALGFCDDLASAVAWCTDPAALDTVMSLVGHPEPAVRRSVAQILPRLAAGEPLRVVPALVTLSDDDRAEVRDCACYALGTRLSRVDTDELRTALLARLDDDNRDVRAEALLGLARRHDPRVLPALRRCLSTDEAWLIELTAAGAYGDPSLHTLVRARLAGWPAPLVPAVCATLRLTDPDGLGADLIEGLAEWYAGPMLRVPAERYWWQVALHVLEQAEDRAVELAGAVERRMRATVRGDRASLARLYGSMLGRLAAAHGWVPG